MSKNLQIDWVPLSITFKERLETIAAAIWIVSLLGGLFGSIFLSIYLVLFSKNLWIFYFMIVYLIWIFYFDADTPNTGGRRLKWVRNLKLWEYFRDYFPLKLVKSENCELDPKKNYLFCSFPHGFLCAGAFCSFLTEANGFRKLFPGFKPFVATLSIIFRTPFVREYGLSVGACNSSKESLSYILSKPNGGNVAVVMVGGVEESLHSFPRLYRIVLKNRKGFIKVALKNGSPLVPVFSFGETDLFYLWPNKLNSFGHKVQKFFKSYGMPMTIINGRGFFQYNFGIIPHRRAVTTVVGKPIDVPKLENPTNEDISHYHKIFMEELIKLFENNKLKYLGNEAKNIHLEFL